MSQVVEDLCERCRAADGSPPRVHWPLARRRRDGLVHQLAVRDGEVVGYGCAYRFDPGEAEVVIAVAPAHRRSGVAGAIWLELASQLERWSASTWLGFVPRTRAGKDGWWPPGGAPLRVEQWMSCRHVVAPDDDRLVDVELVEATVDDFSTLAELDAESFGSDAAVVLDRLHRHCDGVRRRAHLARVGAQLVGKIHLRCDDAAGHIHDLCIRPRFRGRGLGLAMVSRATRLALDAFPEVTLDVEAPNEAAVRLYTNVGFAARASWTVLRYEASLMRLRTSRG